RWSLYSLGTIARHTCVFCRDLFLLLSISHTDRQPLCTWRLVHLCHRAKLCHQCGNETKSPIQTLCGFAKPEGLVLCIQRSFSVQFIIPLLNGYILLFNRKLRFFCW